MFDPDDKNRSKACDECNSQFEAYLDLFYNVTSFKRSLKGNMAHSANCVDVEDMFNHSTYLFQEAFQCNPPPFSPTVVVFVGSTLILLLCMYAYHEGLFQPDPEDDGPKGEQDELQERNVRMNPNYHHPQHDAAVRLSREMPAWQRKEHRKNK